MMSKKVDNENPFTLFKEWFDRAQQCEVKEPAAVALATCNDQGQPSVRIMLLRGYDERGFCFFTNLTSRKGHDLQKNPNASLCFHWDELDRQIRIEGKVERVTEKEADDYFASRSRGSQIGAWASKQSLIIQEEDNLSSRVTEITEQFQGQEVPRPPFWSGFRLVPSVIEFWQRGEYRLHSRLLYSKIPTGWQIERLFP